MLKFNGGDFANYPSGFNNLNTSNVKVQHSYNGESISTDYDLNTSNVKVQLC